MLYEARQPPRLNYVLAVMCILLSLLGFLVAGVIPTESTTKYGAYPLAGWGIVIACFAVAAVFLRRASDKSVIVRADANGLYSRLYSDATIPWAAIAGVQLLHLKRQSVLRVKLVDKKAYPAKPGFARAFGALDNAVSFGDFGINPSFYDRGIRDLLAAVGHYRPDLVS